MNFAVASSGKPRISTPGHGGRRTGAGRKAGGKNKTPSKADNKEANNAYAELAQSRADREEYRAKIEEIRFKQMAKELVYAADAERQMGIILKTVGHGLDSLPDLLERECGLDAETIERVIETIDAVRESMYANLTADAEQAAG
ncbi:MAG: DUF1441 family protein [Gammaproteobacteria bacterium]|nr:DUF1441 family protein [Gammaproteobacteria bacterium]